ncbi:MAG: hypothetical protein NTV98_05490 [Candidatus Roizmanbacteria bacterium]|nr:hypothetical protein [Candidatus Roizmanbacteria bacterium]
MASLAESVGRFKQTFGFLHKNGEDVLSAQRGIQFISSINDKLATAHKRYQNTEKQYDLYATTSNGVITEQRATAHRMWLKQKYFDPDCQIHFSVASQKNEETQDALEVVYFQTETMALLGNAYLLRINTAGKDKLVKYKRIGNAQYTVGKKAYELNSVEMEHCHTLMESIEKDKNNEIDLPTQDLAEDNIAHLDVLRLGDEPYI